MKALIFGKTSQLAHDLIPVLKKAGYDVTATGRDQCDVSSETDIWEAFAKVEPELVVNCTAFHNLKECETDPYWAMHINAVAPLVMAEACGQYGANFVHFSTDYVFSVASLGDEDERPFEETDTPFPLQKYGMSKYLGEKAIHLIGGDYLIIRTSSLFGKAGSSGKGGNFVETVRKALTRDKVMKVVADVRMSPTYTKHLALATTQLLQQNQHGLFHVVNGCWGSSSWYEFACEIQKLLKLDGEILPISIVERGESFVRPRYSVLSMKKLWESGIHMADWHTGLEEYLHD